MLVPMSRNDPGNEAADFLQIPFLMHRLVSHFLLSLMQKQAWEKTTPTKNDCKHVSMLATHCFVGNAILLCWLWASATYSKH